MGEFGFAFTLIIATYPRYPFLNRTVFFPISQLPNTFLYIRFEIIYISISEFWSNLEYPYLTKWPYSAHIQPRFNFSLCNSHFYGYPLRSCLLSDYTLNTVTFII